MTNKQTNTIIVRHNLNRLGLRIYTPTPKAYKRILRSIAGVGLIVLGATTSLIPFTSLPCYVVGGALLGFDLVGYYKAIKKRLGYNLHRNKIIIKYRVLGY